MSTTKIGYAAGTGKWIKKHESGMVSSVIRCYSGWIFADMISSYSVSVQSLKWP